MKSLLFVIFLFGIVTSLNSEAKVFRRFQKFIKKFNKVYDTPEEFEKRYEIFLSNFRNVEIDNDISMRTKSLMSYNYGVTQFSDMTTEEFQEKYLTLKAPQLEELKRNASPFIPTIEDVPENFDWRDNDGTTPVKNQGSCGSCWAFSTMGNIESLYKLKYKEEKTFSEQQLVDCDTEEDQGCNGGLMEYAYDYLTQAGVMEDKDYPYTGKDQTCKYDATKATVKINGYEFISEDEEEIKKALVENGPLSIALNATPLQFYTGGIYTPLFDWLCSKDNVNHAVLLVGYGVEGSKKYWIVKNSWGTSWGEKGHFRIIRGKGACGINTYVITTKLA